MDDEIIIAWDEGPYADHLRDETKGDVSVATSRDDLDHELRNGTGRAWADVQLVILLELAWEGQRARFHGFELVKELLLEDFDRPLVLCSYLEKENFYSVQGVGRFLARMPFPFVRLPAARKDLVAKASGAEASSAMWRAYVRENYLAQEPFARIAHDMRQALSQSDDQMERTVQRLLEDLDALEVRLPGAVAEQRQTVEQALRRDGAIDTARASIDELRRRLEEHGAPQDDGEAEEENAAAKSDYAVLLVEDDDVQREQYRRGLAPYFDVFAAESAAEALDELRTSERTYLAVVADWVLLEEDGVTWQPMQGFDLLVEAWEESGPLCLIALTSLHREAVASVLRSASHEIDWFSKSEVGDDARWPFHAFAGYLRKRVRALLSDRVSMPQSKWWTERGLGDLLLELKYESGRWEQVRTDAEEMARQIVEEFFEKDTALAPVNAGDYKLTTPGRTTTPKMSHLEKILPLRLAVLAGHLEHGLSPLAIRRRLRKEEDIDKNKVENRAKQWYPQLGLERDGHGRIPETAALAHERDWFRRTYGTDLKEAERQAQAQASGTQSQGLATELNTFYADVKSIPWTLNRRTGKKPEDVDEITSMQHAVGELKRFARWADGQPAKVRRLLRRELAKTLAHDDFEGLWAEYEAQRGEIERIVQSLRS
jgi:CheY-like chemotaxis protein